MKMNRGGFHQPIYAQCHSASIFYKNKTGMDRFQDCCKAKATNALIQYKVNCKDRITN